MRLISRCLLFSYEIFKKEKNIYTSVIIFLLDVGIIAILSGFAVHCITKAENVGFHHSTTSSNHIRSNLSDVVALDYPVML